MGSYLAMLINRGRSGSSRIASEAGFKLFSGAHIAAEEFGPGASYGYGIAVDEIDGHARLRHTGGMVSFASALEVDLDSGVGVFASVNAMQGYRPRPVAGYALKLMRACREAAALPPPPPPQPPLHVEKANEYAGRYVGAHGRVLEIIAEGDRLYLLKAGNRVVLEPAPGIEDGFLAHEAEWSRYVLAFGRKGAGAAVVEAGWGGDWYAGAGYEGPREFEVPAEWQRYPGHYRNDDPWIGSVIVVIRRGKLWLNGVVPLALAEGSRFWLRDEAVSPEWVSFEDVVNGRAMRLVLSGADLKRT